MLVQGKGILSRIGRPAASAVLAVLAASAPAGERAPASAGERAPAAGSVTRVADFESGIGRGVRTHNAQAELVRGVAAGGVCSLRVRVTDRAAARRHVRIPLPAGVDMSLHDRLICHLRVTERGGAVWLRFCAVDAANWIAFQRRFEVAPGDEWVKLSLPLHLWRWGDLHPGDWSEVRSLVLQIESPVAAVEVDEVGLVVGNRGRKSALPTPQWYQQIAFAGRNSRSLERAGFMVATDAVHELAERDLAGIITRMEKIDKWVRRVFGAAVRPTLPGQAIVLIIFRREREYRAFFRRLGEAWRVDIPKPKPGGYTVQDISASTYDKKHGAGRPVYFHESVHGVVTRRLRLLTGVPAHSWFHEGLANYLQLCVYPKSFDRRVYVKSFAGPVGDGGGLSASEIPGGVSASEIPGGALFQPLATVMSRPARPDNYAQLASLVAYMAERRPALLGRIAAGLRAGTGMKAILRAADTDFGRLQAAWLAWGRERFAPDAQPPNGAGTHFTMPREWRPEAELQ